MRLPDHPPDRFGDRAPAKTDAELQALRRAVERDRYGLMAYVLMARDHCTPLLRRVPLAGRQAAGRANMDERVYENLITRYAPSWNAPPRGARHRAVAALPPSMPTGKPTNAEFPIASSTPPVNIMTPEPGSAPAHAAAAPPAAAPAPRRPHRAGGTAPRGGRQEAAAPKRRPAPVQIAPAARGIHSRRRRERMIVFKRVAAR
jgi:hypothetical protein